MLRSYSMVISVIVNNNLVYRTFTPMFISEIEFVDTEREYNWNNISELFEENKNYYNNFKLLSTKKARNYVFMSVIHLRISHLLNGKII